MDTGRWLVQRLGRASRGQNALLLGAYLTWAHCNDCGHDGADAAHCLSTDGRATAAAADVSGLTNEDEDVERRGVMCDGRVMCSWAVRSMHY